MTIIDPYRFAASGVTASLSTNDPTFIPNTTASLVTITLSSVRGVDTVFTVISTNELVTIDLNPVTISAGLLTGDFAVSSPDGDGVNPFDVTATAAGVTVLNSVELTMVL